MADGGIDPTYLQRERFLLTQLLILALPGVPAFYLPALLAAPNDLTRFRRTGHRRDLNRPQFKAQALERRPADPDADASVMLPVLSKALAERAVHRALHPDAPMKVLSADRSDRVILQRFGDGETLVAVHNMTASRLSLRLGDLGGDLNQSWSDCLSGHVFAPHQLHSLEPYAVYWLVQP